MVSSGTVEGVLRGYCLTICYLVIPQLLVGGAHDVWICFTQPTNQHVIQEGARLGPLTSPAVTCTIWQHGTWYNPSLIRTDATAPYNAIIVGPANVAP